MTSADDSTRSRQDGPSDAEPGIGAQPPTDPASPLASLAARFLERAIARGRLAHAYLVVGPEGAGKRALALWFGRRLFCREQTGCGLCAPCRSVDHGNHPGFSVFGPAEGKSVVDIDTVRALCERSHYARDHAFVAVVEQADGLTEPAANALLKTLEEPPGEFILVLLAASTGALLPTIVSRCHRLYLPAPHVEEALAEAQGEGGEALVRPEAFEDPLQPGFFARHDTREWIASVVPSAKSGRERVRHLLLEAARRERRRVDRLSPLEVDAAVERLGRLLELLGDLAGAVNSDLVLEQYLALAAPPVTTSPRGAGPR